MTDHERLIAAARASIVTARGLQLPASDPDRGVAHDALRQFDRLALAYRSEREAHDREREATRELKQAVILGGARLTLVVRALIALVLAGIVVAVIGYVTVRNVAARNTKGIEVSCTLLSNVVVQAGAAGGRGGQSKAALKQREITALAFDVIVRQMTPAEQRRFAKLNAQLKASGGFVTLPDCSQVAEHPESVMQVGTQQAQRKP